MKHYLRPAVSALTLALALVWLTACTTSVRNGTDAAAPPPDDAPYRNPDLPTAERVEDLLARMTLDEKIGQMTQADISFISDQTDVRTYALGSVLSGGNSNPPVNTPDGWADLHDGLQQQALTTRLGIPLLYGVDAVHGHNNLQDATVFPHNIGLGATRNPELVERIARATAREMAGTGMRWNFAPSIGVPQDPRWGRTYEGFSENPELVGELGAAAIRGYQTGSPLDSGWVLATPKHWIGDGGTDGGVDQGNTVLSLEELITLHGTAYRPAIDAGARVVMASYNSWNGEKVHGSGRLLSGLLRNEFGFNGMILSDWGAIYQLPGSVLQQTRQAIDAGIDMNMVPDDYRSFIAITRSLVEDGSLTEERIDEAVRRILTLKFDMGLFESPFADRTHQTSIRSSEHLEIARQAVRESVVLLRNEDATLPIDSDVRHVHVAGRFADDIGAQAGGWTIDWQGVGGNTIAGTSIRQAVTRAAGNDVEVTFSNRATAGSDTWEVADLIVAVIGEAPYAEFEGDRSSLNLHEADIALLEAFSEAEAPVAVVLLSGRPLVLTEQLPMMDALLAAWLPGSEGDGIADILFGTASPSGRLPMTWPRSNDQIPIQQDEDRGELWSTDEARAAGYGVRGESDIPLFPYGFGLGYEGNGE
ncbi:MAG: glycoside hydrolase family 3 protein [Spirochaetaceae bacterium]